MMQSNPPMYGRGSRPRRPGPGAPPAVAFLSVIDRRIGVKLILERIFDERIDQVDGRVGRL